MNISHEKESHKHLWNEPNLISEASENQLYNRLMPPSIYSPPALKSNKKHNNSGVQSSQHEADEDRYRFMGVIEALDNTAKTSSYNESMPLHLLQQNQSSNDDEVRSSQHERHLVRETQGL